MKKPTDHEDRYLRMSERELVAMTRPRAITERTADELQAIALRLRAARNRARTIARQQQREMRGKAEPKGAQPARDNAGTVAKTDVLAEALTRVSAALRNMKPTKARTATAKKPVTKARAAKAPAAKAPAAKAPAAKKPTAKASTQAELARKALAMKQAAAKPRQPAPGRTASKGMQPKSSTQRSVKIDPREVGRVSKAGKAAQARRDTKGR